MKAVFSKNYYSLPPGHMKSFFNLGEEVLSLGLGEPGFSTPESIAEGGIRAIKQGDTFYSNSRGIDELRSRTTEYLRNSFHYQYNADEICITDGSSTALDCILRSILNPGDEVIIPAPGYEYYSMITRLNLAKPVIVPTYSENNWLLLPRQLKDAITERTKALILNYPCNPTGAVASFGYLQTIADILQHTNLFVLSDEIYAEIRYQPDYASILHVKDMRERTFLLSGYSKNMAMTGWRIGYFCAPIQILEPAAKIYETVHLCPSSISQNAALEGLISGRTDINMMIQIYKQRLVYAMDRVQKLGWKCNPPGGTFYLWANIATSGKDSLSLVQDLITNCKVALIPGIVYGEMYSDYVRISFSKPIDILREAFDRIEEFLNRS